MYVYCPSNHVLNINQLYNRNYLIKLGFAKLDHTKTFGPHRFGGVLDFFKFSVAFEMIFRLG